MIGAGRQEQQQLLHRGADGTAAEVGGMAGATQGVCRDSWKQGGTVGWGSGLLGHRGAFGIWGCGFTWQGGGGFCSDKEVAWGSGRISG